MRPNGIENAKEQVLPFLRVCIINRGFTIDSRGFFRCPAHDEENASAHFLPDSDETRWHCFGCSAGGNIFDFVHHTDGLPLNGAGWLNETLRKLCDEFNVELSEEDRDLSPEQRREQDIYRAYEKACQIVVDSKRSEQVEKKLAEYGWSKRTLRVFGIGGLFSYQKYVNTLVKAGFSREFLDDIGLTDRRMFRPECLIFTVKDATGRPVGFSSRYLNFEEDQKKLEELEEDSGAKAEYEKLQKSTQPKYVNTGSKNPVYRKKEILFGYHASRRTSKSIWIFEGNPDAVSAYNAGLINSGAICNNKISEDLFRQLLADGITHFIFALDSDNGGREGAAWVVELSRRVLADHPRVRVELVDLTLPGQKKVDPDQLIRQQGLGALIKLSKRSYHYWGWVEALRLQDAITVAQQARPEILAQLDPLLRWQMLDNLGELTRLPKEVLWCGIVEDARRLDTQVARDVVASCRWMEILRDREDIARKAIEEAKEEIVLDLEESTSGLAAAGVASLSEKTAAKEPTQKERINEAAISW